MEEITRTMSEGYIFIFLSDIVGGAGAGGRRSLPYSNAIEGAVVKYI